MFLLGIYSIQWFDVIPSSFPMSVSVCLSVSQIPTCFATCNDVSNASPDEFDDRNKLIIKLRKIENK